jgi:hypothetical protein
VAEPYRDDSDAWVERLEALERELQDLDRAAKRRLEVEREIETLRAQLREARERGPLEDLRIASPCTARWEEMTGDDRVRHCAHCDNNVYNVAGMTRGEALKLVHERSESGLCLRMFRRADGTVLTADCPVGERKKRVRRLVLVGAGAVATLAAGYSALAGGPTLGGVGRGDGRRRPPALLIEEPYENEAVESGFVTPKSSSPPLAPSAVRANAP